MATDKWGFKLLRSAACIGTLNHRYRNIHHLRSPSAVTASMLASNIYRGFSRRTSRTAGHARSVVNETTLPNPYANNDPIPAMMAIEAQSPDAVNDLSQI